MARDQILLKVIMGGCQKNRVEKNLKGTSNNRLNIEGAQAPLSDPLIVILLYFSVCR